MSNTTQNVSRGCGPASLLGIAFVVLKLCGVITWSWWWVTAPFWGPIALVLSILLVTAIIGLVFILPVSYLLKRSARVRDLRWKAHMEKSFAAGRAWASRPRVNRGD
jgi:membrane protein YdbS with pleckstrin-like domain